MTNFWKFKEKFLEIQKVKIMRNIKNIPLEKILQKSFVETLKYFCGNNENFMWKFRGRYVVLWRKF